MRLDCRTCRNMALDKVANVKRQHETDMTHAISYTYISRFYGIRYYCIYLSTYQFAQGFYVFSYAYLDTNLWISLHPAKRYINIGHRFCKYRLNNNNILLYGEKIQCYWRPIFQVQAKTASSTITKHFPYFYLVQCIFLLTVRFFRSSCLIMRVYAVESSSGVFSW